MYAVISDRGKQYTVREGTRVRLDRMEAEPGSTVEFDRVLLVGGDEGCTVGVPVVEGASVSATVLCEYRDRKIIVFKKKRRKMYRRKQGHRQRYTDVQIQNIGVA